MLGLPPARPARDRPGARAGKAAGCQLVASCDLAVASEQAAFATPGVKIGLFCTTPMIPLVRVIPPRAALEMLMTAAPISAQRAMSWAWSTAWFPVMNSTRPSSRWWTACSP